MLTSVNKPRRIYCYTGLLLFFCFSLVAQQDSSFQERISLLAMENESIPLGYGVFSKRAITGAIMKVSSDGFNLGIISDPLLLLQGRVAGLQTYNRGGDPNGQSIARIRGLSAYSQASLLVVIDGVVGASLQNVDPNDIESITVLKDGSAQAMYGIRGSNGVLLVRTQAANFNTDTMTVSYQGQFGVSTGYPGISVMNADEFRAQNSTDFGASTDWLNEIKQTGLATNQGLAIQGQRGATQYRVSGNYRNVMGVLQNSGFEQFNTRANLTTKLFREHLTVKLSAAYTSRNSDLGFQEAFRYAMAFNPTAPILAQDTPFPFNVEQFGGFFETTGLFDSYNPKALIELNSRKGKQIALTTSALLEYRIGTNFSINFRQSYQQEFSNERAFYSPQSYFRGNAYNPLLEQRGRADLNDYEEEFSLSEFYAVYEKKGPKASINLLLGTAYQDGEYLENYLRLDGFTNENLLSNQRIIDYSNWENEASITNNVENGWSDKLSAFFGRAIFSLDDQFFFSYSLRSEGASKLGVDNNRGQFRSLGVAIDLNKWWAKSRFDHLMLKTSYGITGMLPQRGGLSQSTSRLYVDNVSGEWIEYLTREANSNLKWEQKKETNIGLDFAYRKVEGSINWYRRNMADFILEGSLESRFLPAYVNQDTILSSGLELNLSIPIIESERFSYTTALFLSTFNSRYEALRTKEGFVIAPGGGAVPNPTIPIREGDPLGNIVGPFFTGADEDGNPVFSDINRDGVINTNLASVFDVNGDFAVIGNGLPYFEWGWQNQFRVGDWELDMFLRGAVGHSLVNMQRLLFESGGPIVRRNYNVVNTEYFINDLNRTSFSSLHVEDATFVKLANLSLSRNILLGKSERPLRVSLTGQDLLVFTDYTGADPEPVFVDMGVTANGSVRMRTEEANPFASGIDRRNYYLPNRAVVLGLKVGF